MSEPRVKVERNRYGRKDQPWLVRCGWCASDDGWFLGMLLSRTAIRGWAPSWRIAQDFALQHALQHERRRCPTCLHVPLGELEVLP